MTNSLANTGSHSPSVRFGTNPSDFSVEGRSSVTSVICRLRSSAGTNRQQDLLPVAGRYEEAALPDYGIDRLHVTLDPALLHSYLTVQNIDVYQRHGDTRIAFNCPRQIDVAYEFEAHRVTSALKGVSDQQFDLEEPVRAFSIHTPVVLGNRLVKTDIWLLEMPVRSTDLVLGSNALNDAYRIDPVGAFCLDRPSHRLMDLLRHRA